MSSTDVREGPVSQVPGVPEPPPVQQPVLRRSRQDRMVFGVAGGLGRYLGVDPVIIRIALVLLTLFGGSGVLLYLIGLVVIPEEAEGETAAGIARTGAPGQNVVFVLGAALVVIGSLSLVTRLVPGFDHLLGPALLIGVGALVLTLGGRR